jgi:hypothetical protein
MNRLAGRPFPALLGALMFLALPLQAQEGAADRLESTRTTLAQWVETQQIISREKRDWQVGKEVLEQRIALLRSEIAALEEKIGRTEETLGEADRKRREIDQENARLRGASSSLEEVLVRLEAKTLSLVAILPEPIRDRVKPLSVRIPENPAETEVSLGERFVNVLGVLNEVNKFNGDITLRSELQPLPDGTSAEVQVLYVGLGQAYFVTADGGSAGIGRPTPEGWVWEPADAHAPAIAQAIAILKNEQVPAYVPLPVRIQ